MFDAKLKEAVGYFEQMLKVMPDDSHTLEFLSVAYAQLGETEKGERALAELARVLLKKGDLAGAIALMPQLEAATAPEAKAMAVKLRAAEAPKPELVPEKVTDDSTVQPSLVAPKHCEGGTFNLQPSLEAEAAFAEALGERELAESIRAMPDNGRLYLVSALATLERERPDVFETVVARLAEETGDVPIPLDAFEPDRQLVAKLPVELVRVRGVIPFARLGETALVVTLAPKDEALKRQIADALACPVRFYLAEPRHVEAALAKLFPEGK